MLHSAIGATFIFSLFLLVPAVTRAEDAKPAAKPEAANASTSEPRTQTLKGFTYFYCSTRTNFEKLGDHIKALIPAVEKAMHESHANPSGPLVFIYKGVDMDPKTEFELQIGLPIAKAVEPVGDFKVREVAEYPCTSVIYTGPMSQISSAYEKLLPAVVAGNAKPTDESREMMLYFESPESPNNVVHISIGKK